MDIMELKKEIIDRSLNDDLLVFVCPENTFLAESYIDEICAFKNLTKRQIATLSETTESALSLVLDYSADMNMLRVETFDELADDYSAFKNCVVLCEKVDKVILEKVKDYVVQIPKLIDWQIKDYIKAICPALPDSDVDWLYAASGKNIYKIDNELRKLRLLKPEEQSKELKNVCSDMFVHGQVFDLVDALVKNDVMKALDFLRHANDYNNLDPIGLTTLMLTKFRNILFVCYKSGVDVSALGLSKGALWYLRNDGRTVPFSRVEKAIRFLSNIDSRLKSNPSSLDFSGNRQSALLEYVVLGTLACSL
jgi:hypothetical protein